MIILSCALWSNWLPLFVGSFSHFFCKPLPRLSFLLADNVCCVRTALTFIVAPLPNALFSHCGGEEFSPDYNEGSGPMDIGRFVTAFIVVTGFALPLVLAHSEIIKPGASIMSLIGGGYVRSLFGYFRAFIDNPTLTQLQYLPSHAVLCMGPSWPILQLSGKRILITSSLNVSPVLSPEDLSVSNNYMTIYGPPTCFNLRLITSLWAVRRPFD